MFNLIGLTALQWGKNMQAAAYNGECTVHTAALRQQARAKHSFSQVPVGC